MLDKVGQATIFTKMDMKTGFHQIRIKPEDIEKTAITIRYGLFEFLVMPMGLCNAPATFQSLMNSIFFDFMDLFVVVYIDDLLIFSKTKEEHLKHLELVLERLEEHELYIGKNKCAFMQESVEFLGLKISKNGISIEEDKKKAIKDWPKPSSISEIRSFIGLLQFFRRFIRRFSEIAAPLTNLTRKNSGIQHWDSTCDTAFQTLKTCLISAPILMAPDWKSPFRCHVDAMQTAVGGTLTQLDHLKQERVIAYFSKRLNAAEENYTSNERELLGLVYFLKRFRCYLEGSDFEVITDNQVLSHFLTKKNLSRREARWLDLFAQFNLDKITLVQGRIHVLGDALSRIRNNDPVELSNVHITTFHNTFRDNYNGDQFFSPIIKALKGDLPKEPVTCERIKFLLPHFRQEEGILYYKDMVCVPRKNVTELLQMAHNDKLGGHFSFIKTLSRLEIFHWQKKYSDVKKYCAGCYTCQQSKDGRKKPLGDPQPLEIPTRRWGSVGTDFITHLPTTRAGHDAITTYVDRFTKRVHFIPSSSAATAEDIARDFYDHIFKYHGLPDSIVSDRDPRFTSRFWTELMKLCEIKLKMSTSHHPQTDGCSEITNRMIENFLRCYCDHNQDSWDSLLTAAEFAYNSANIEHMNMSPFELDLGWKPKSPLELLSTRDCSVESVTDLRTRLRSAATDATFAHLLAQSRQKAYNSKRYTPPSYKVGDSVWLSRKYFTDALSKTQQSRKLGVKRYGPFKVLELIGKNAIRLDLPPNITVHPVVHVEHTSKVIDVPADLAQPRSNRPSPITQEDGTQLIFVDRILRHRKRSAGFQWLAAKTGAPIHEAEWQPTRDFVDNDGTINEAFHKYITENNLLPHLHNIVAVDNRGGRQ